MTENRLIRGIAKAVLTVFLPRMFIKMLQQNSNQNSSPAIYSQLSVAEGRTVKRVALFIEYKFHIEKL